MPHPSILIRPAPITDRTSDTPAFMAIDPVSSHSAYYDASGSQTDGDSPLVIGVVVSSADKWHHFEMEWIKALSDFGMPYLHMKEFTQSKGPFEPFATNKLRRDAFVRRLVGVAARGIDHAFAARLVPSDYAEVNRRYPLEHELCPGPYSFLMLATKGLAEVWVEQHHRYARLNHVVEAGDAGQKILNRWHTQNESVTLQPKKDAETGQSLPQFQAADLIAYETRLAIKREREGSRIPRRASFRVIRDRIPLIVKKFEQRELFAMCRDNPTLYPRRTTTVTH